MDPTPSTSRTADRRGGRPHAAAAFIGVALASGLLGCSSSKSKDYGKLSCLDGWPAAPTAGAPPASLSVTPQLIWQVDLGAAISQVPGVALAGDRLLASAGSSLVALDRHSGLKLLDAAPGRTNYFFGSPVVDLQGRAYVQSLATLFGIASDGSSLWEAALPNNLWTGEAVQGSYAPSLVGEAALIAQSTSGTASIGMMTGGQQWTRTESTYAPVGHWGLGFDQTASYVVDLRTGKAAGRLVDGAGHDVMALLPLAGRGILAVANRGTPNLRIVLLDTCGKEVWALDLGSTGLCDAIGHVVVGPGEVIYLQTGPCARGPNSQIVGISADGKVVSGPVAIPQTPWLAGVDGTLYATDFHANSSTATLLALSPSLAELWRLSLTASIPSGTAAALADDGVLYAQLSGATENSVIAIQTASPGLATSSWPTFRHDNRSTNWGGGQF